MKTNNTVREKAIEFNIGDKVFELSDIEGEVIESPFAPALIRVSFDGKGGNWRDLKPHQLTLSENLLPQHELNLEMVKKYGYPAELLSEHPDTPAPAPITREDMFTGGKWKVEFYDKHCEIKNDANIGIANIVHSGRHPLKENSEANAQRIVTAVNNFDAMKELLEYVVKPYPNVEWVQNQAKAIINNITNQ